MSSSLYCTYPDSLIFSDELTPLQNLEKYLKTIKNMGFDNVHILPFLKSPRKDSGYDVEDYFEVDPRYGTLDDLSQLIRTSKKLRLNLFMDLMFNHVSNTHKWFQKAISGDDFFREFFIYSKTIPYAVDQSINQNWTEYNGFWYYHSFHYFEMDLNWSNPILFNAMVLVLKLWTEMGFNFRIYFGINPNIEIFLKLKQIALSINSSCIFISGSILMENVNYIYNFKMSALLWVALLKENVFGLIEFFSNNDKDPTRYINFLRNHDELVLSILSDIDRHFIYNKLKHFHTNNHGIIGTSLAFLLANVKHYKIAYFLLSLFPGIIMFPSGEEFLNVQFKKLPFYFLKEKTFKNFFADILGLRKLIFLGTVSFSIIPVNNHVLQTNYKIGINKIIALVNISTTKNYEFKYLYRSILLNINSVIIGKETIILRPLSGIVFTINENNTEQQDFLQ